MQRGPGGFQGGARPAEARLPGGTVYAAAAGAERAGGGGSDGDVFGHNIQVLCKRFGSFLVLYYTIFGDKSGIIGENVSYYLMIAVILISVIVPTGYSYLLFRKGI